MKFTRHIKTINRLETNDGIKKARTIELRYNPKSPKSVSQVNDELNNVLKIMRESGKKGYMTYSIKVNGKWDGIARSAPITFDKDVDIFERTYNYFDNYYNDVDSENPINDKDVKCITNFRFFVTSYASGGQANDTKTCFYDCLTYYQNKTFTKASFLYSFLKIKYASPITLQHAIFLQNKCHFNLHVSGDEVYEPIAINPTLPHYYLILANGHWSVNRKNKNTRYFAKKENPRPICIYQKSDNIFTVFDEQGERTIDELDEEHNNIDIKYVAKERDEQNRMKRRTLEAAFTLCNSEYSAINELTKGKINPYCFNGNIHMNRYFITQRINHLGLQIDNIEQYEHQFISKVRGPYSFCVPGEYDTIYSYDVKKQFASTLNDKDFKIPIKKGKLTFVSQEDLDKTKTTFRYGIYHVNVASGGGNRFAYNRENVYPSDDLQIAVRLGLYISVIDNTPNALLYPCTGEEKSVVSSKSIFGEYIDELNEISKSNPNIKLIKGAMASLYGAFIQMNLKTLEIGQNEEIPQMDESNVFCAMYQKNETTQDVISFNVNKIYKYNIARLKPFIYARQRLEIFNYIVGTPNFDDVVYLRTDGFYSTKKLDFPKIGQMGDMLYECEYHDVKIENMNKITKKRNP